MKLVNIANDRKTIYLFIREDDGSLTIKEDNTFFPYYFVESPYGDYTTYNGKKAKQIFVSAPHELKKAVGWQTDVKYTKQYLIDRVPEIKKAKIKYCMIDIEIQTPKGVPNPEQALYPISCLSIYNSLYDNIQTFFLGDYATEHEMLEQFIYYMQREKFDVATGWNFVNFDYLYLFNRVPDFATRISPIRKERWVGETLRYPAGISIIDYYSLYKKLTLNRKEEYTLDFIMEEELGKGKTYKEVDFSKIDETVKKRNIEDVEGMRDIEKKIKLIDYYDVIRRLAKVEYEDLLLNSRVIDNLILMEAKKRKICLPSKRDDIEHEEYEGAFRDVFSTGAHFGIYKADLSSAYPASIVNFCLDPANIRDTEEENTLKIGVTYFKQVPNSLIPTVVEKLLVLKDKIKNKLQTCEESQHDYYDTLHSAIKSVVNSSYGTLALRFFRIYDKRVAEATAFLVRDLLHYVKDKIEENQNYRVVYADTDSLFYKADKDLIEELNKHIQQWVKERFNKDKVDIFFSAEGIFDKLLLLAKCRYIGYLNKNGIIREEMRGIEAKRKDSSKYTKVFQRTLVDKILNKEPQSEIDKWVENEIKEFPNKPIEEISFPCRVSKEVYEKNTPIHIRAYNNTRTKIEFDKGIGEKFYYVYVKSKEKAKIKEVQLQIAGKEVTGNILKKYWKEFYNEDKLVKDMTEEDKDKITNDLIEKGIAKNIETVVNGKEMDVFAFDDKNKEHILDIDLNKMLERNIYNKVDVIFEAMNWTISFKKDVVLPDRTLVLPDKTSGLKDKTPKKIKNLSKTCTTIPENSPLLPQGEVLLEEGSKDTPKEEKELKKAIPNENTTSLELEECPF